MGKTVFTLGVCVLFSDIITVFYFCLETFFESPSEGLSRNTRATKTENNNNETTIL